MGGEQAASVLAQVKQAQLEAAGKKMSDAEVRAFKQPILDKYDEEGSPYYSHRAAVGRRHHRPGRDAHRARARADGGARRADPRSQVRRVPHVTLHAPARRDAGASKDSDERHGGDRAQGLSRPFVAQPPRAAQRAVARAGRRAGAGVPHARDATTPCASSCSAGAARRSAPAPTSRAMKASANASLRRQPGRGATKLGRHVRRPRRSAEAGRRPHPRQRARRRRGRSRARCDIAPSRRATRRFGLTEVRLGIMPAHHQPVRHPPPRRPRRARADADRRALRRRPRAGARRS